MSGERRLEGFPLRRLGIAGIEESLAVLRPGQVREAHPVDLVLEVLAGGEPANADRLPVRPSSGEGVREMQCVGRRSKSGKGGRPLRPNEVGIDQLRRCGLERLAHVERGLKLKAAVGPIEQPSALDDGEVRLAEVPQPLDPAAEVLPQRLLREVTVGEAILRGDPRRGFR